MDSHMAANEALALVESENAELEAEIEKIMTKKSLGAAGDVQTKGTADAASKTGTAGGIVVLRFGATDKPVNEAGVNKGSNYRPPQTGHRTLTGGFFG
eukprot:CAMPEP_0115861338 /NCGR_PEP_ID=MMETSP0287-20121206/17602_1 /TAXON_ID=412157 /ORGANISM="Chrysochromulina rotalis, Strain UIO044" /LENGTH=97 /DNA_ID=CAMNT_0003315711 /DNA_START=344 /DNA_END=637 /DNA_ORIENTATION=+